MAMTINTELVDQHTASHMDVSAEHARQQAGYGHERNDEVLRILPSVAPRSPLPRNLAQFVLEQCDVGGFDGTVMPAAPMAIEVSAAASAGASLMPSPTMATWAPSPSSAG